MGTWDRGTKKEMEYKSKYNVLSGKMCGTKSKGRQRTKYTDSLNNFVTRKESTYNELIRRTDDREDWRRRRRRRRRIGRP